MWKAIGALSLVLGAIGVFLPLLPTTPFILLAAFAFQKGSPKIAAWLEAHRIFGPLIEDWRRTGAISTPIKTLACTMMALSLAGSWYAQFPPVVLIIQSGVLIVCAVYILSRPSE